MYLIPLAHLTFKLELHLLGGLLRSHHGRDIQKSQTRKLRNAALYAVRIGNGLPKHLITATDTYYERTVLMSANDSLSHSVSSQFVEVVKGGLSAWDDDDVGLLKILYVIGIEEIDTLVTLKYVEIRKVTDMPQQHHGYVHLALLKRAMLLLKLHAVLLLYHNILKHRYNTKHRYSAKFLKHLPSRLKQSQITTELIDYDALDASLVLWRL